MNADAPKRFLSKAEAAQYLGSLVGASIGVATLDRYRRKRAIPYTRIAGHVMFKPADLEAWLDSGGAHAMLDDWRGDK